MLAFLSKPLAKLGALLGAVGLAIASFFLYTSKVKRKERKKVAREINSESVKEVINNVDTARKVEDRVNQSSTDDIREQLRNKYTRRNSRQ